jgi:hypothetical protein
MKKLILSTCIVITAMAAKAQVTKQDFETVLSQFKLEAMKSVYVNNIRTYYTDGTNKLAYWEYTANTISIELTATAVHFKNYTDNSKTTQKSILVIPYASILNITATPDLTIRLKE